MSEKPDQPNSQEDALNTLAVDQSLETVRDILFGAQVREANQRDADLEKLFRDSMATLEKRIDKHFSEVEKNIQQLEQKLAKSAERTAEKINKRFEDTLATINDLQSTSEHARGEMHEQLNTSIDDLETRAQGWNEDLARQLEVVHQQLLHSKTDRTTLANLLANMAQAIIDDDKT